MRRVNKMQPRSRRRGAAAIEAAVSLAMFVTLVLGMLDMGLWVFRQHILAQAARQIARMAVVHGSLADRLGPWGPYEYSGDCSPLPMGDPDDPETQIRQAASDALIGFDPANVSYSCQWIDGGNDPQMDHRVRCFLSADYQPIVTFIFGNPSFKLTATATMEIAH